MPDFGPKELSGDMEDFDAFYGAVSEFSPAEIRFDEIPGDAKGYYSSSNKEIVIRDGMSEAQTAKTMVHEVAHAWLHDREKMASRSEKKTEAKSKQRRKALLSWSAAISGWTHRTILSHMLPAG